MEGEYADARVGQRIMDPAMVTVEDFSRLVSGIYAAAVIPQRWESAIRDIHRTLGGTGGGLMMADGGIWSILHATVPDGAQKSYAEHYCRLDHVLAAVEDGPVGAGPDGYRADSSSPRHRVSR